jgi:Fur family ferric uptake transcriptional regulator
MSTLDELKNTGLKATAPRQKILQVFQTAAQRHLTADDVYRLLLAERTDIGLATVYRALTQFEQAGILSRHHFEGSKAVYELRDEHHHDHFVCLSCGKVEEFMDAEIERRQRRIAQLRGWIVQDHTLSLHGLCPVCRDKG